MIQIVVGSEACALSYQLFKSLQGSGFSTSTTFARGSLFILPCFVPCSFDNSVKVLSSWMSRLVTRGEGNVLSIYCNILDDLMRAATVNQMVQV